MGVPAFFAWLVRRYPKVAVPAAVELPRVVDGEPVPIDCSQPNPSGFEIDNLYLDMNGIIHPCTHPEDKPPPANEEEMLAAIFEYIEFVFSVARPRKLLYMAIDGVAPRAKMNQQRSRRFKSALEAAEAREIEQRLRDEWEASGKQVPPPKESNNFDSNCITPGTPFMDKVARGLRLFAARKINEDPGWHGVKIILTDSNVPGEGEHKIMDFIRHQRAQPGYDANTTHAIYGLDADLIMLALATHEVNFYILREEISRKTNGPRRCNRCGEVGHISANCVGLRLSKKGKHEVFGTGGGLYKQNYNWIDISILREYLDAAFNPKLGGPRTPFPYDLERVIDDFNFMCFFVGNDFLPHLPTLEIRAGAIDLLMRLYKGVLARLGGYITKDGKVDIVRAGIFITEVAMQEDQLVSARARYEAAEREKRRKQADVVAKAQKAQRRQKRRYISAYERKAMQAPDDAAPDGAAVATVKLGGRSAQESNAAAAARLRAELFGDDDSEDNSKDETDEASKDEKVDKKGETNQKEKESSSSLAENKGKDIISDQDAVKSDLKESNKSGSDKRKRESDDGELEQKKHKAKDVDDANEADLAKESATNIIIHNADDDDDKDDKNVLADSFIFEEDDQEDESEVVEGDEATPQVSNKYVDPFTDALLSAKEKLQSGATDGDGFALDAVRWNEPGYKDRYYKLKFNDSCDNAPFVSRVRRAYVEGLCWVMLYYYQGCPSWEWFFPYHYAPFAAELADVTEIVESGGITFSAGRPFRPFEQLMAVLPPASAAHVPSAYRSLMLESDSPIIDFYPEKFAEDMNGHRWRWQAVALLPFIEQKRLLAALEAIGDDALSADERRRNRPGIDLLFAHLERNPIGAVAKQLYGASSGASTTIGVNATAGSGICAELKPAPPDVTKFGKKIRSPCPGVPEVAGAANRVVAAVWLNPPLKPGYVHLHRLLKGAKRPERRLDQFSLHRAAAGGDRGGNNRSFHQNQNRATERQRLDRPQLHSQQRSGARNQQQFRAQQQQQFMQQQQAMFSHAARQANLMPWQQQQSFGHPMAGGPQMFGMPFQQQNIHSSAMPMQMQPQQPINWQMQAQALMQQQQQQNQQQQNQQQRNPSGFNQQQYNPFGRQSHHY